jgi:hypothetical protein
MVRHDPVQGDHRARGERVQHPVQGEDLRPVGVLGARCLVVHRRDRGLQLERADRGPRQRAGDERDAFGDRDRVPAAPILLGERAVSAAPP